MLKLFLNFYAFFVTRQSSVLHQCNCNCFKKLAGVCQDWNLRHLPGRGKLGFLHNPIFQGRA